MKKHIILVAGLVALLLGGCTIGSRRMVTATRKVRNFDQVVFEGIGGLTIRQDDRESLTIEAESNVMRRIKTEVRGGTLYIGMRGSLFGLGIVPTRSIKYTLTMKEISALDLSGVGSIYAAAIDADRLDLDMSGAGRVIIRGLRADKLVVGHTGVGQCELSGEVKRQVVDLTGAGEYDAADLESESADITVSGVGKATVWATDNLDIEITGGGYVGYYGNPRVTQDVSGVGQVRSLGRRH